MFHQEASVETIKMKSVSFTETHVKLDDKLRNISVGVFDDADTLTLCLWNFDDV